MRTFSKLLLVLVSVVALGACKKDGAAPEAAKGEPAKTEAAKAEPGKEAPKAEIAKAEPAAEPAKAEPAKEAPKAAPKDMKGMKLTGEGWEGQYNEALQDWTFEKYTPGADGMNEPNRFYVTRLSEDQPTDMDAYAEKLTTDKNFQDMGYLYTAIASKEKLDIGWLILGTQKDMTDDEDKGAPGFVLYRSDFGIVCRGSTFVSDALRAEAVAGCKSVTF